MAMKHYMLDKVWVERYESLGEALEHAGSNPSPRSSEDGDEGWAGCKNLKDAVETGKRGYTAIRPDIDVLVRQIDSQINLALGEVYVTKYDRTGDSVDMGRYMQGDPECMIDYEEVSAARMGRVVRILINGSFSCGVRAETIRQRGAMVVALCEVMSKIGVGLEVWLENSTASHDKVHSTLIKLHDSKERIDIDNLMFAIAHPSMLRRIGFSVMEQSKWGPAPEITRRGGGYGQAHKVNCTKHIEADVVVDKFEDGSGDFDSNALQWIMSTVTGLGLVS